MAKDAFIFLYILSISGFMKTEDSGGDAGGEGAAAGDASLDCLLTKRQIEVLKMRQEGRSQQQVAEMLGTTRSNISILEKRAHQNISRAERTLQQWMMIRAPISLKVKAKMDVFELPKMIFAAADEKGLRLPVTSLDIIVQLRRKAPQVFKKRALEEDAMIFVTEEGEILAEGLG
jgi:Tfx family DNA-binding protein